MKPMKTSAVCALLLAIPFSAHAEPPPAFPGAEGAGKLATGGRGGTVVHVTNLNAAGPGSLADAVSQPNRIVLFDVSGIIDLREVRAEKKEGKNAGGKISIEHPNITIAGQTAPGEGVCIKGGALQVEASNIIIRYLRSRRGWLREGDMGDCIGVKPTTSGEKITASGQSSEAFEKRRLKKESRGKFMHAFTDLTNIVIDHCSTSWATDENLTVTHANRSTISWSIAAEGCDYTNPNQTPMNHSEGSLWGCSAPDGRSTMHHMLYAHNRLRNPRTTAGDDTPAVLTLYNSVVYDWSEFPTHTGSERVHLQWLSNYYKPGPGTPADIRGNGFLFQGDPEARVYPRGNIIEGSAAATNDNRLAVGYARRLGNLAIEEKAAMIVGQPFTELPANLQSAAAAYETVLAESGATLPARDAVDLRIVNSVRTGTGKIIGKEIDLAADQRWPDYRSIPQPKDSDGDGLPDFWERQFGLNPNDANDSAKISASGYANIEHYFNNTDPTGGKTPIVFVSAAVSRALVKDGQHGEWRFTRIGDTSAALDVHYEISGDAVEGRDFERFSGMLTIPAGKTSSTLMLSPLGTAKAGAMVVIRVATEQPKYHVGCPSESLIVIQP